MKKVLKIVSFSLLFALLFSSFASAEQNSGVEVEVEVKNVETYEVQENVGVSNTPPGEASGEITPNDMSVPTARWDLSTKGQYNFSGAATINDLYTNYLFYGKSTALISVTSHAAVSDLVINVKKKALFIDKTVYTATIRPGSGIFFGVDMDPEGDYYIEFEGPSNFSGYIR